jgi:transcriptional regulator with XRE-family HTH domain
MKLKELRTNKNLSQNDLGKIIGVSGQTILNWENGINEPSIVNLIKLADYFDISIDYLVDRKETQLTYKDIRSELDQYSKEQLIKIITDFISNVQTKK